jgi:predicted regulator of Ras-like GTPase activity (Roadblock/LC7/MglB family)
MRLSGDTQNVADIKTSVHKALDIGGCIGAALVDFESGLCLGVAGNPGFDLELAAAGNTEVVRAKKRIRDKLGLRDGIEDILISLTSQYHLIRMVGQTMFLYTVLDREKSNLALARKELQAIEKSLDVDRS